MEKRILLFEDDEGFIMLIKLKIKRILKRDSTDLNITYEDCINFSSAKRKIDDIEKNNKINDYNLIIIDLKLPFSAPRPEPGMPNEFLGLKLTRLIREKFPDKIQYLPVSSLIEGVKNLDPKLHGVDQIDIDKAVDKIDSEVLASIIVKMLTQK